MYRTGDKRTTGTHSIFTLAPSASAFGRGMISGTKPAGEPTDPDLGVFDPHGHSLCDNMNIL